MNTKKLNHLLRVHAIDDLFYSNKTLGPIYTKKETTFNVWAPLATEVNLIEYQKDDSIILHPMSKQDDGVFTLTIKKDLDGFEYNYQVKFDNIVNETTDPYAKATTANSKRSVVVNLAKTNPKIWKRMPKFKNPTDAIIYELSVRDFSIDPDSKFKYKGKFLALTENKGIKYLKSLGITHIQLLPIYDFSEESVDELNPLERYNWGYDPVNYNVVEGSYSTDPTIPNLRIKELKKAIQTLHDNGIRVIMDVVYNHVYDAKMHCLDKITPDYAFRMDENCNFSNGSACGNDLASNHKMIRKYIVDSIIYWAKEFNLDGFRFDLMGILDVETMQIIRKELNKIDEGIIILGEGWHLNTDLKPEEKASQSNADKLEGIAFFNDDIRDSVKGSTFKEIGLGFVSSWEQKQDRLINSIKGGNGLYTYTSPSQVIQYVEAHDNYTLFDQLSITKHKESNLIIKKMHKLATSIILTSQGIPFIHAGQEFFRTKYGIENSYKSSDKINKLDWNRAKENKRYIEYVKNLIALRKSEELFRMKSFEEIEKNFKLLKYTRKFLAYELGEKYIIIANSSKKYREFPLNGKYRVLCDKYNFSDKIHFVENKIIISNINFVILKKEI